MKKIFALITIISIFSFKPSNEESIKWISIQELEAALENEPRKVMIDVYTDWCGWCKKMDATTFKDPKVSKIVNEKFYAVKFNAESTEEITLKGQTYKFVPKGKRGYNELAAALMSGQMSYPTVVYLDENLDLLSPVPGFQKAKSQEIILSFFGNEIYKTETTFQEYEKSFEN